MSKPRPIAWLRRHWFTFSLGMVLSAQGVGKLVAFPGYIDALAKFDFFPLSAIGKMGAAWLLAESAAGIFILLGVGFKRAGLQLIGAGLALLTSTGYAVLTFPAYFNGIEIANCTCFGVFLPQRLSVLILFQDVAMLYWAGSQMWTARSRMRNETSGETTHEAQ